MYKFHSHQQILFEHLVCSTVKAQQKPWLTRLVQEVDSEEVG